MDTKEVSVGLEGTLLLADICEALPLAHSSRTLVISVEGRMTPARCLYASTAHSFGMTL